MENTAQDASSVDLSYYSAVLRKRWRLVVLGLVVGVLASVAVLVVKPQSATSWAMVNVNPIADIAFSSSRPASDLLVAETEQAMARSTTVVENVAEKSRPDVTPAQVRVSMVAMLLPDSTVLRIDYTAGSPEDAAAGAELVAQEYLDYRSAIASERIDQAVEKLEERLTGLDRQLQTAIKDIAGAQAGSPAQFGAEARRQSINDDITSVNGQLNQLRAISTIGGTIISQPDPERAVLAPNRGLILVSGVLGGLLLGLVLPFLGNALDRRVRDGADVARAGGGALVAVLDDAESSVPAAEHDSDQLRAVRERLLAAGPSDGPVVATIDVRSDGTLTSDLAVNLAVTFADLGKDTRLILTERTGGAFARLVRDLGLVEGRHSQHSRHFHSRTVPSLEVVSPTPMYERLASADVLAALLLDGRRSAVTVVGVGPGDGHAVRLTAARLADHVVLGVSRGATAMASLTEVVSELRAVGASVLGTILIPPTRLLDDGSESVEASASEGGDVEERDHDVPEDAEEMEELEEMEEVGGTWFSREEYHDPATTVAEDVMDDSEDGEVAERDHDVPEDVPEDAAEDVPEDVPERGTKTSAAGTVGRPLS